MTDAAAHDDWTIGTDGSVDVDEGHPVRPFELFFDLVFVFAFTQVTALIADDLTWGGFARGGLVIAAIWWAWAGYTWLGGVTELEEGINRVAVISVMGFMLICGLAVPSVWGDGALVFAVAYLLARSMHVVLYLAQSVADRNPQQLQAVKTFAPTAILGPSIILTAAIFDVSNPELWWLVGLAIDYAGPFLFGADGWKLHPEHFAERHRLIVIIALGEALISIGVGAKGLPLNEDVIVTASLAFVAVVAMWWAYFDVVAIASENRLAALPPGRARNTFGRDAYTYLHLPVIAGTIWFALGVKKTLAHPHDPLPDLAAWALAGGVTLYLVAHILWRLRGPHTITMTRVVAALGCAAFIPIGMYWPAVNTLSMLTLILVSVITYEALHIGSIRRTIRATRHG